MPWQDRSHFNPRSPWGERPAAYHERCSSRRFQSTLPVGGATRALQLAVDGYIISIHAPRGGSDHTRLSEMIKYNISIHAPRGGSDSDHPDTCQNQSHFNPRSPWGERPDRTEGSTWLTLISIHAPRGGSDSKPLLIVSIAGDFNPRSPWGERLIAEGAITMKVANFNPRSPWGERPAMHRPCRCPCHFNPRSPWGERRLQ